MGFDDLLNKAGSMFNSAKEAIEDKLEDAKEAVEGSSVFQAAKDKFEDAKEAVEQNSMFQAAKEKFEDVKDVVQDKIADLTGSSHGDEAPKA